MRLLPVNRRIGWTPYAWLIYLPALFIEPVMRGASATEWTLTIGGAMLFLVAYFRGYWLQEWKLLPVILVLLGLGVAFTPVNSGASIFFVYGASFGAQLRRPRYALAVVLSTTAIAAVLAWSYHEPAYYWLTGVMFTPLIGGVNLHFAQDSRANARLQMAREEVEHMAAVAERERIARDLHDVLGHTLSLIVIKSELASKLAERDPKRAAREIRDVEQVARTALSEVREAIRGVRSATLDDEMARGRALLTAAGIRGDFASDALPMDRAREEALALALRETITNTARHSGASACKVRVQHAGATCTLEVEDDGRGGIAPEGGGLRGMRERVEALGGTVARSGSRGTRLIVTMPVTSPQTVRGSA
ncbi:MAG: sensor histidine kinase [Gemmatimonadota bacterium]|nr:sensor histidine kinase [Gemmatimonadota bacterium]